MDSGEISPGAKAATEQHGDGQEQERNGGGQEHEQNGEENHVANHSDEESVGSEKRKHQRGGRKAKSKPTLPSESHKQWSQRNGRLEGLSESGDEVAGQDEDPKTRKQATSNDISEDFETGIKAFNLKRAQSTGNGRPIGVSIDREKSKGETSKKKDKKKKKKKKKQTQESSGEEDSDESSDEEPAERKPLSIRLDLNLELEIFLRAKVKGDITITFLE